MSREIMQKALSAFEAIMFEKDAESCQIIAKNARYSLREALAQPEQEPVAWQNLHLPDEFYDHKLLDPSWYSHYRPLYTAPPRKEWVSLSDTEINKIVDLNTSDDGGFDIWCDGIAVAHIVCAKLKELNK